MLGFVETFVLSFFTFFAVVSPVNTLVIFMSMTGDYTPKERRRMAVKSVGIATIILFGSMFFGIGLLKSLGISVPALRTGGGILLLLVAIGMMFGDDKEASATDEGHERVKMKKDITIFPLTVPIIAGPGGMSTSMLLMGSLNEFSITKGAVVLALSLNLLLTLVLLLLSDHIITRIKKSIIEVFLRIAGLILASLAVQFIFDGLRESKIFVGM